MLSIGTNMGSSYAKAAASSAARGMEVAMERLATGKRINAAKDDAAGMAISSRMESNIRGLNQAVRNALDAQALIDTAEGGIQEVEVILQRIRELAVQAANDTNSAADRANLDAEAQSLLAEMDRISNSTTWAGQNILDGANYNMKFQIGSNISSADLLSISMPNLNLDELNLGLLNQTENRQVIDVLSVGQEFQVNTATNDFQSVADVAELSNGNSLIVWQSAHANNEYQIYGQIYDTNGSKVGVELRLSHDVGTPAVWPSVSHLVGGGFVVTWSSDNKDGSGYGIFGQRYDDFGQPIGGEFSVNTTTIGPQLESSVTALNDGSFIISWVSQQDNSIYGQRFDSQGVKNGLEFRINAQDESAFSSSAFAVEGGGFGVTWRGSNGISTQLFNSDGSKRGERISISDQGLFFPAGGFSSVALNTEEFVTTWFNSGNVYVQKSSFEGLRLGEPIKVNLDDGKSHIWPTIAKLPDGKYLVTWTSQDSDGNGVFGRVLDGETSSVSNLFQINSHETSAQQWTAGVRYDSNGFIIAWSSMGQDGDGFGVFAQRFQFSTTQSTVILGSTKQVDLLSTALAASTISSIDYALSSINMQRAYLGSVSNRLEHSVSVNTNAFINLSASQSRIMDADYALESASLAKHQILQQSSVAMLAQANASKQSILQLLDSR